MTKGQTLTVLGLTAAVLVTVCAGITRAATPPVESELKKLGTVPTRGARQIVLSADGQHVAYVLVRANKHVVVRDDKEGPEYDSVKGLCFSPNGKHLVYAASRLKVWFIVIDDKEGEEKYSSLTGPVFSPNGKVLAYVASVASNRASVVLNGVPQTRFAAVGQEAPTFSPDSRHLTFEARTAGGGRRTFRVRDPDRPDNPDESPPTTVTDDGQEVDMGSGGIPRTHFLVRDGEKQERCNDVRTPVYSPNSKVLLYAARFARKWFIVCEGKKVSKLYEDVRDPVFSPNGRKLAYAVKTKTGWHVICGQKKGEAFESVQRLTFSPDGDTVAYAARQGREWFVVCGGRKGGSYAGIDWVGFSPDGRHLACVARRSHGAHMVCDGVEGPRHGRIAVPEDATKTEGKLRYVAIDAETRLVEIDWPTETDWTNGLK